MPFSCDEPGLQDWGIRLISFLYTFPAEKSICFLESVWHANNTGRQNTYHQYDVRYEYLDILDSMSTAALYAGFTEAEAIRQSVNKFRIELREEMK